MKKMIFLTLLLAGTLLVPAWVSAQVVEAENTYTITGKAKKGTLAEVTFDGKNYTLVYVTKSNEKMMKTQTYTFDIDFKFIDMKEEEIDFEKAKTRYKWFVFRGELYSVMGNYVEPNLMGTLILKKKKITYKYDWFVLGYYSEVEILEKVKPKTDDGRKFHYYSHAEDNVTGDIYVICGIKPIGKDDPGSYMKKFTVLKFNSDLDLVKEYPIDLPYYNSIAFARMTSDPTGQTEVGGLAIVFAPFGGPGMSKTADPNMNNFTYVRLDNQLNQIDKFNFESKCSYWKIDEMIIDGSNDAVYFFGPAISDNEKYYNILAAATKFKTVQLMKVSDHKVEFLTTTNLEEFEAKLKTPPIQKKSPAYAGKKFSIANYHITDKGEFIVSGQNFDNGKEGPQYKDILGFHFDSKGVLKAQYGVDTKETNKYAQSQGAPQNFIENPNTNELFWMILEIKGVATWNPKPLTYPRLAKIGLDGATVTDFTDYGSGEKKDYYLDPKFPFLETDGGGKVVFFGSDKSGSTIWFCRVALK